MKTLTRNSFLEVFSNPINRNLIIIITAALAFAVFVVTAGFLIYDKW